MSVPTGTPHGSPGPSTVKVPVRGVPGPLATFVVVGVVAVIVGISLLDTSGDRLPERPAAVAGPTPTERPTPRHTPPERPTPQLTPLQTPSPLGPATGGTPLPDVAGALPGDDGDGPLPLGTIDDVPNADRLDFLFELCQPECYRDAHWLDPNDPKLGSGVWTAGRPFHVREGFINDRAEPLGEGFDVVLYVTRMDGGAEAATYRYTSDYVLRGISDRCGPTYRTQTTPATCEWFVHDFPKGLPDGRFAIWAVWEAPCRAWIELGVTSHCADPDEVVSLFSSGFDAPYSRSGPSYAEAPP